jgi:hypothetical protein
MVISYSKKRLSGDESKHHTFIESLGSCADPPVATRVTYVLGGMMSGPLRLTADLDAKIVRQADHPPGQSGDGARLNAWTMPVTSTRGLTPEFITKISTLAG